ncbi:MAG: tetratricopeptide repeat protein, partial [Myxococcales bacterium]|nr:tetratricopeptide repeat protein [Myxococcales bacterium]
FAPLSEPTPKPESAAPAEAPPVSAPPSTPAPPRSAATPAPPSSEDAPRSQVLPPAPDPDKPLPAVTPKPEAARAVSADAPRKADVELEDPPQRPQRRSRLTPTPGEARYSFSNEDTAGDVIPSDRRTSAMGSRRSSAGSVRLIVGVLVCGAMIFIGILLVQRFLPKERPSQATADARVESLLEAGEASFKDGDLDAAKEQFVKASALAEKDPRVARALARLAVVRAEIAWLELLVATADDPGREATRRRYSEAAEVAAKAAAAASDLAASDPEVARVVCDAKRLQGDVSGARKLVDRFSSAEGQPDTLVSLAARDLAEKSPEWRSVVDRLNKAADQEGNLGRARALLVYALARSGDAKGARVELGKLGKLPRTHPLEAQLTRFVERSERGENLTSLDDLPSVSSSKPATSASPDVGGGNLKAAQDALARGNLDQAEKLFEKVVADDPNSVEGLSGLAGVARQRGQAKRAIGIYERILSKNASNVAATVALADLKWDAGDQGAARMLYRKAIDLGVAGAIAERARSRMGALSPDSSTSSGGSEPTPTATTP